jgi:hypothetical protein
MPGRGGRRPKAQATRSAESRRELQWTELGTARVAGAPQLPAWRKWRSETKAWYETWRRSPQASQFFGTDWQSLHMLALLVDSFCEEPTTAKHSEIRLTEARLGSTVADRLGLRWRVTRRGDGPADDPGTATEPATPRQDRGDPRLRVVPPVG